MKKLLIIGVFLNAGFLFAIWQQLSVVAEVGGGAGVSPCEGDPTKYSLDTNDDGTVDLSDFVGGLNWFFSGGEAPRVCLATDDLEARVAALETSSINNGEARLVALEGQHPVDWSSIQNRPSGLDDGDDGRIPGLSNYLTVDEDNHQIVFTGANVYIQSGVGTTDEGAEDDVNWAWDYNNMSGLGNLIIGYNEGASFTSGAHNLILGIDNNYTAFGGLVTGRSNEVSAAYGATVSGYGNVVSGEWAATIGGQYHDVSGPESVAVAGDGNTISTWYSTTVGGYLNDAVLGHAQVILGGFDSNSASANSYKVYIGSRTGAVNAAWEN